MLFDISDCDWERMSNATSLCIESANWSKLQTDAICKLCNVQTDAMCKLMKCADCVMCIYKLLTWYVQTAASAIYIQMQYPYI